MAVHALRRGQLPSRLGLSDPDSGSLQGEPLCRVAPTQIQLYLLGCRCSLRSGSGHANVVGTDLSHAELDRPARRNGASLRTLPHLVTGGSKALEASQLTVKGPHQRLLFLRQPEHVVGHRHLVNQIQHKLLLIGSRAAHGEIRCLSAAPERPWVRDRLLSANLHPLRSARGHDWNWL